MVDLRELQWKGWQARVVVLENFLEITRIPMVLEDTHDRAINGAAQFNSDGTE